MSTRELCIDSAVEEFHPIWTLNWHLVRSSHAINSHQWVSERHICYARYTRSQTFIQPEGIGMLSQFFSPFLGVSLMTCKALLPQ